MLDRILKYFGLRPEPETANTDDALKARDVLPLIAHSIMIELSMQTGKICFGTVDEYGQLWITVGDDKFLMLCHRDRWNQ